MFFINFLVISKQGLFHLELILGIVFREIELSLLEEIIFHFLPKNKIWGKEELEQLHSE